eukprot:gene570-799_t
MTAPPRPDPPVPAIITDPLFYAVAIPAVIILGLSKGGFAGVGTAATPMLALYLPPLEAAALTLPLLITQDLISLYVYRRHWDASNLKVMLPGAIVGVGLIRLQQKISGTSHFTSMSSLANAGDTVNADTVMKRGSWRLRESAADHADLHGADLALGVDRDRLLVAAGGEGDGCGKTGGLAGQTLLGKTVYGSLKDVPGPIDMVEIFRNSEAAGPLTDEALALEPLPKVIWMQLSVRNDEAAARAEAKGVTVIMNRCPKIEYGRLSGEIGWQGINSRILSSKKPVLAGKGFQ